MKSFKNGLLAKLFFILLLTGSAYSQDIVLGTDFVSRYVWRGYEVGANSPSIQPNVALVSGGFTLGFWGAFPFASPGANAEEVDIYASYAFSLGTSGSLSIGFTDYMYPNAPGFAFTNFNDFDDTSIDGPGSHDIEVNVGYSGPESFPISVAVNIFAYGVEDNPIYWQLGYNTSISDVSFSVFAGGTVDSSAYYGVTGFDVVNLGFTASKSIPVSSDFSIPIFGSIIFNPALDDMHYVVGLRF